MNDRPTMRAMVYDRYGDPDVLHVAEVPRPKVGPGEVLLRVRAAAVNPVDWKIMAGRLDPLMDTRFPVVPGWDVAGVVEQLGIDVPEYDVGDAVMAYARKDYVHGGTVAEFVTLPVRTSAPKPPALSWEQAAGLPLTGLTAYQSLTRLGVGEGDTVLVHGAAGGVGTYAVQLARHVGARVIGTASAEHHEALRQLGAEPVEYGDGLVERVREIAPGGVDVVADYVGGVLDVTTAVLAEDGRHASIADQSVQSAGGRWMWVRPDAADLARLGELVEAGSLTVPIAATFPLEDAADAYRLSQTGHVHGKIAIRVSGDD